MSFSLQYDVHVSHGASVEPLDESGESQGNESKKLHQFIHMKERLRKLFQNISFRPSNRFDFIGSVQMRKEEHERGFVCVK